LPVCTVLDPALVLIGGEGGTSEVLVEAVQEEIMQTMTPLRNGGLPVRSGALGDEAMMLGAVALVTSRSARP
jgi:predicted NBD/HSP70 family sugar kinase